MRDIEEIKTRIHGHKLFLNEKFKVKSIGIFGSYLRAEQSGESDIDILVEFHGTIDLFEFVELENFLSEILGSKVDLVMKDTLKSRIKDRILRETVNI